MPSSSSSKGEPSASSSSSSSKKKSNSSGSNGRGSSSGGGQLNALEKRIYQAVLSEPDQILSNETLQANHTDLRVEDIMFAVNSLLSKSLFTMQRTQSGIQYQALSKSEASTLGSLDSDEAMIYSQIREAGNEGVWTKQLKIRTNLHQTIMTRCLKSLESKSLIKAVKSVKFPTRKIYMLYNLTPSIELSGGPWYTDHDFDAEYVSDLCNIIHKFIMTKTWPKGQEGLYLASHTPSLPTAATIQVWVKESGASNTALSVENIQNLLDVLIYDDKIEKVPCFPNSIVSSRKQDRDYNPKGKKKGYDTQSESGSGSGSDSDRKERSRKGSESDRSGSESESGSGSESEEDSRKSRKRKHSSHHSKSSSRKSSKRHRRSESRHSGRSSTKHRKSKESDRRKNSISAKSILLSDESEDEEDEEEKGFAAGVIGSASQVFVYRAVRPFFVQSGWTEIPCGHCPVFNFCETGGPVNAESCVYMKDWIYRCKASDIDGDRKISNGLGQIADIEEAVPARRTTNGLRAVEDDAGEEEKEDEEDEDARLAHVSELLPELGVDEQDEDDYGGEEV